MHPINYVETNGTVGLTRVLATFELVPTESDKIAVWDRVSSYHSPKAYVRSVEEAVKLFKVYDDSRVANR